MEDKICYQLNAKSCTINVMNLGRSKYNFRGSLIVIILKKKI